MKGFNIWFRDRIQKSDSSTGSALRSLAVSPLLTITSYQAYEINGYTFYTTAQDKKSTYQNSGVRIEAVDNEEEKTANYGQIEDIWELNYLAFKVPVFRCRWVKGAKGVMKHYQKNWLMRPVFIATPIILLRYVHLAQRQAILVALG